MSSISYTRTDGRTDTAIAIGAPLWCERVWQGSGHVTFHDASSTLSRRICHSKSKPLHQLKKKGGVIRLPFWLPVTRESSWGTYGFHLLLANGGSRILREVWYLYTNLRRVASQMTISSTRSWKYYYRVPLSGHLAVDTVRYETWVEWWAISDFLRKVSENCPLRGYNAASSGNFTDVSGQPIGPIILNPEVGTDRFSRNVGKKLPLLSA